MFDFEQSRTLLQSKGIKTIFVGLSGGLDSVALLNALVHSSLSKTFRLKAIHVNHQLSQSSQCWERFCREFCQSLNIPFISKAVTIKKTPGVSLEEMARESRYAAIREVVDNQSCLMTAHHQQDQIETFLYRIFRGTGLRGAQAMRCLDTEKGFFHVRPWLEVSKKRIEDYANEVGLTWIEDESNQDEKFDRNYIRHQILPVVTQRFPTAANQLSQLIADVQLGYQQLHAQRAQNYPKVRGSLPNTLSKQALLLLPEEARIQFIRHHCEVLGVSTPPRKKLPELMKQLFTAAHDRQPLITWDNVLVRCYGDDIYVETAAHQKPFNLDWDLSAPLKLPNGQTIRACGQQGEGYVMTGRARVLTKGGLTLGEKFKKACQNSKIPSWKRAEILIVSLPDGIIAPQLNYGTLRKAKPNEHGYKISIN